MVKCKTCGHMNNDGSARCILCNAELEAAGISAYDELVQRNIQAEYAARRVSRTAAKTFGVLLLVFTICFAFFLIRVATAEQRAQDLAAEYFSSRVMDVDRVEFTSSFGSCLEGGYVSEGFELSGICHVNGQKIPITAIVRMKGVFDSGEVVSAYIAGKRLK